VVRSWVEEEEDADGRVSYYSRVEYLYEAHERPFIGQAITWTERGWKDRTEADGVCQTYPPGAKVAVRYAPDRPEHAFLQTQSMGQPAFSWLLDAGFAGAALAFSAMPNAEACVAILLVIGALGLAANAAGRGGSVGIGLARWRPGRLAKPDD
jgi:hypothetical protein